jgi:di/tricarboxylate transporter
MDNSTLNIFLFILPVVVVFLVTTWLISHYAQNRFHKKYEQEQWPQINWTDVLKNRKR